MTFKQWLIDMLQSNGLWPKDAEIVFEEIKSASINEPMAERWNDKIDGYPESILSALWISAKRISLEWIDKNQPGAFYRQMFA